MQRHPNGVLWGPPLGRSGQAWFPCLLSHWLRLPGKNVAPAPKLPWSVRVL